MFYGTIWNEYRSGQDMDFIRQEASAASNIGALVLNLFVAE